MAVTLFEDRRVDDGNLKLIVPNRTIKPASSGCRRYLFNEKSSSLKHQETNAAQEQTSLAKTGQKVQILPSQPFLYIGSVA